MVGRIHSQESFGTVDGPGIRYVLFLQGCPMRCLYCHNPDTWQANAGKEMTAQQVVDNYLKNREFYTNGGITVTGGEPLMQTEFVTGLFRLAKKEGIHTCLDTSGIIFEPQKLSILLQYTDLVLLDIKHIDPEKHKKLCGADNTAVLKFAKYLEQKNIPVWIRHVVVEGITDDKDDLFELGRFIGRLKNVKALDVIPYHTMGVSKYQSLGIDYPLCGIDATDITKAEQAKKHITDGIKYAKTV